MFKIFKRRWSIEQGVEALGERLIHSAESFYENEVVMRVEIRTLGKKEQDMILLEIIVNVYALAYLVLDTIFRIADDEQGKFVRGLRAGIVESYLQRLLELGAHKESVDLWRELIERRIYEYEQARNTHRESLPEPHEGNMWLILVSMGCFLNIRGEGKNMYRDSLYRDIEKWLGGVTHEVEAVVSKVVR